MRWNIDPVIPVSSKNKSNTFIEMCAMNSIHSVIQHVILYHITIFIFFVMIGIGKCLAQTSHSPDMLRQDTSRSNMRTYHGLNDQLLLPPLFIRLIDLRQKSNDFTGLRSILQILTKHPELRDVALKEYIHLNLSNNIDINFAQSLSIYLVGNPILENDLKRNMQRFGVPYDPIRPKIYQIGYTVYLKNVISWIEKILRWILTGNPISNSFEGGF
jgi:hypothetical protein